MTTDRQKADRRIPPAVAQLAIEERAELLARIAELEAQCAAWKSRSERRVADIQFLSERHAAEVYRLKAQPSAGVVLPERADIGNIAVILGATGLYGSVNTWSAELIYNSALDEVARLNTARAAVAPFQVRVFPWLLECFGDAIAGDTMERNHRFLEEALELVQACGCTPDEAHKLVDYVFGRRVGERAQEVGGVMVTLAALCLAQGLDMHQAGETELSRITQPAMVELIREKQKAKPAMSPLPGVYPERLNAGRTIAVLDGYVPVRKSMLLDAASLEALVFVGGGINGDDDVPTYLDCVMWVGDLQDDDGKMIHGLHAYCTECEEEGSITLAEFAAAPSAQQKEADV